MPSLSFQFSLRSLAAVAAFLQLSFAPSGPVVAQTSRQNRTPVLVELFTSEGCSSCPPADALLAKLDHDQPLDGAEVIVLGEHVDYWDELGWHDRFSSHQFTERQSQYSNRLNIDGVYTPQMIVDGTDQFVGNDAAHARRAIVRAAQTAKINLTLSRPIVDGRKVSASLSSVGLTQGLMPASQVQGDIYVALVDPTDTTEVRAGENGGRKLQHAGVVRTLQRVGTLKDLGSGQVSFSLNAPANSTPANMRVVAFAQRGGQGAVLGAVSTGVTP